ncbi:MAG: cytochrome C biogenesis protein [Chloroflexi bacterium]|nr:MAG: cytochrome C biogenesis protein [Chloroflexota bacterium]
MNTPFIQVVFSILRKDLRTELRSRELVSSMALFTFLSILVFSFALELDREAKQEAVSGVLWVTLVFASILGLNRSLASEREEGNMDAMLIAPVNRIAIYMGKMLGNFIFTVIVGVVLLPVMTVLFNFSMVRPTMILILILGILGLSSIGTLLATMTVQTRSRETLLPIAMLPVVLPVILTVVRATNAILNNQDMMQTLLTIGLVDVLYITLGSFLFEYVTED